MPVVLLWLLPVFEVGLSAFTFITLRGGNRSKVRDILIYGIAQPKSLPVIDTQIQKAAGAPTKSQAAIARWITRGARLAINTKAFEYAVLLGVKKRWAGQGRAIDPTVRLCL